MKAIKCKNFFGINEQEKIPKEAHYLTHQDNNSNKTKFIECIPF